MKITLLQKRSQGIEGTYQNADHHARALIPLLDILTSFLNDPSSGLPENVEWVQGHNVHLLKHEGRTFVFRPFRSDRGAPYAGITMSLRVSRAVEIPLASVRADEGYMEKIKFVDMLKRMLVSYRPNPSKADLSPKEGEE